jgi:hypothetical protein
MELVLALIIFGAMIVAWFLLPGTVTTEETHKPMVTSEGMSISPIKA